MKFLTQLTIFLFLAGSKSICPVLDGRSAMIYLENRYTFTNFEWARGNVYFKKGFDLPVNGTVILDINQEVDGLILFQNSTLRLDGKLMLSENSTMSGSGYLDARGSVISFRNNWIVDPYKIFIISSDVIFEGTGVNYLSLQNPGSGISVSDRADNVTFRRFNLGPVYDNRFYTKYEAPRFVSFNDCSIALMDNLTLSSNRVAFAGDVKILRSDKKLSIPTGIRMDFFTTVHIQAGTTVETSVILSSEVSGEVIVDNATLSYLPTGTFVRVFERNFTGGPHQGTLIIRGRSQLITPSGTELMLDKRSSLVLESGSLLTVNSGTKFTIG